MKSLASLFTALTFLILPSVSAQSIVLDINPGTSSAQINDLLVFNNQIVMMADDGTWGAELWKSDGTAIGTSRIKDIYTGSSPAYPAAFVEMNGEVFFRADHAAYGFELWKTDGTFGGTSIVLDADPGTDDGVYTSIDFEIVESNNKLFLPLNDGVYGRELWVSDGTGGGTIRLLDTYVGTIGTIPGAGDPKQMTPFGNGILFTTYDYDLNTGTGLGRELWRSNGTVGSTAMVKDIHPNAGSSNPDNILVVGSMALFSATDGTNGDELWKTDGTTAGTSMLKDINPNTFASSSPSNLVKVGSEVFFYADDGTHGNELWKTDGTASGTVLVKDIYPGSNDSYVTSLNQSNMIAFDGRLFFTANDGTHGRDLWVSDGTESGTYLFKDINPGNLSSFADYFEVIDNKLFFYANDGTNGYELWASNGLQVGTMMFADINSGPGSGSPSKFVQIGTDMLFTANNGSSGSELFTLDLTTVSLPLPVELLDFSAELQSNGIVALEWITAVEIQNDYFEVERSLDGSTFESIARVSGMGNTQDLTNYQATDFSPQAGNNIYRLKQVDMDGTTNYSHLVFIHVGAQEAVANAYPNPFQQTIQLSLQPDHGLLQVELMDLSGRVVFQSQIPAMQGSAELIPGDLPAGLYLLQVSEGDRKESFRMIRE